MGKKDKYVEYAHKIWNDFEKGKEYQASEGLEKNIPIYENFFNGIHWPPATKKTKNMPRPVFPLIEKIVDNKISNILSTSVKIVYTGENQEDTSKFTRFAEWQQNEMGMKRILDQAYQNAAVHGTYVLHFYWDSDAIGRRGKYEGALRCEVINCLDLVVSNPRESDIQKQKWVIISQRVDIKSVKEMADDDIDKNLIQPDDDLEVGSQVEQEGSDLCTVLTRYFRKDDEVYFEKLVKETVVHKPRAINPIINEIALQNEEEEDIAIEDTPDGEYKRVSDGYDEPKALLYPIEVFQWKDRKGSIYGRGDVEGIIPVQKAINFLYAMQLLNTQNTGCGTTIVKPNTLGDSQEITNEPGQVIIDYSTGNGWGITKLEGSGLTAATTQLVPAMVELIRNCTNSTEVMTGDITTGNSGVAIARLQEQAQKPIARLQQRCWHSVERIGKILEQFYRLFYEDTKFSYDLTLDELGELEELNPQMNIQRKQQGVFNGRDYNGKYFAVNVEVGPSARYSEIMAMDTLNTLFINGGINNMTSEQLEQFIALYPDSAMPYKAELRAIIRKQKQSELGKIKEVAEAQSQQIEQYQNYVKSQEATIAELNDQVKQLQALMANQKADFDDKHRRTAALLGQMFTAQVDNKMTNNKKKTKKVVETESTEDAKTDNNAIA